MRPSISGRAGFYGPKGDSNSLPALSGPGRFSTASKTEINSEPIRLTFDASKAFMGGLAAFLLSHVLFAVAFLSGVLSSQAMGVAAVVVAVFGAGVLRWLLPHTPKEFKAPVLAYVVVILGMCVAVMPPTSAYRKAIRPTGRKW